MIDIVFLSDEHVYFNIVWSEIESDEIFGSQYFAFAIHHLPIKKGHFVPMEMNKSGEKNLNISSGSGETPKKQSRPKIIEIPIPSGENPSSRVDLVFVIDTTGSMSDKITGLLDTCAQFVDEFDSLNLRSRIAIVAFGDLTVPGDKIVKTSFTSKTEVIKKSIQNIPRFGGGGNEGESSLEAIEKALELPFRPNVLKVIILITDEPALQMNIRASDIINRLRQKECLVFVVSPPYSYFMDMAQKTGGKWYQIAKDTDFRDMLEIFRRVASEVSEISSDVFELGDGSVSEYLRLRPPENN